LLLLCQHRISDVSQIEIHTAEPSSFEVEIAIGKFRKDKPPGTDQILAELTQVGGQTLPSEIYKHIKFMCNKEELPGQWEESTSGSIYKNMLFCSLHILWETFRHF
jgi:hypothetical protein